MGRAVVIRGLKELSRVTVPCVGDIQDIMGSAEGLDKAALPSGARKAPSSELLNKWRAVPKVHPELVLAVVEFFHGSSMDGAILVFLPGTAPPPPLPALAPMALYGGVPCAVRALCEKLAVLHHREFGKFRRLKGRH